MEPYLKVTLRQLKRVYMASSTDFSYPSVPGTPVGAGIQDIFVTCSFSNGRELRQGRTRPKMYPEPPAGLQKPSSQAGDFIGRATRARMDVLMSLV